MLKLQKPLSSLAINSIDTPSVHRRSKKSSKYGDPIKLEDMLLVQYFGDLRDEVERELDGGGDMAGTNRRCNVLWAKGAMDDSNRYQVPGATPEKWTKMLTTIHSRL
ncbi:Hypothetical predicted protein [Olea europaea subsp. europaea]|uniref:Uncharacterized protein n=1 Tax=Olea europaea subsp. europaea TaxID=158383 RepID=A0A8S0VGM5_OLEEU|nr:Hypothetical predicted protein [Olea europaea subsp. europaea]